MKTNPIFLSIIIPVYNEKTRIHNLRVISDYYKKQKYKTEIIIVDDGSTDSTKKILKTFSKKISFKLISYKYNLGKGYAIKKGMEEATGDYNLFMDIDLSVPLEMTEKLIKYTKKYKVIIGSRRVKGSKILTKQPIIRETMGRVFTRLSQVVLSTEIADFTCGFKCFEKTAAKKIFSKTKINRWGFDSEIIFLCEKYKLQVMQIPVSWRHDDHTKVKFPQDIIKSLKDLASIRINHFMNRY